METAAIETMLADLHAIRESIEQLAQTLEGSLMPRVIDGLDNVAAAVNVLYRQG